MEKQEEAAVTAERKGGEEEEEEKKKKRRRRRRVRDRFWTMRLMLRRATNCISGSADNSVTRGGGGEQGGEREEINRRG